MNFDLSFKNNTEKGSIVKPVSRILVQLVEYNYIIDKPLSRVLVQLGEYNYIIDKPVSRILVQLVEYNYIIDKPVSRILVQLVEYNYNRYTCIQSTSSARRIQLYNR